MHSSDPLLEKKPNLLHVQEQVEKLHLLIFMSYNLICSGTVLCNDMFDGVEKKSLSKDENMIM